MTKKEPGVNNARLKKVLYNNTPIDCIRKSLINFYIV